MARSFHVVLALIVSASALQAHGGQYRGARLPVGPPPVLPPGVPIPPSTGGPTFPAPPGMPTAPAPGIAGTTGIPLIGADSFGWQTWWEFNKEPFLRRQTGKPFAPVTGSDDFYLGMRRTEVTPDRWQPTTKELEDRVVPSLAALMASETSRDIQSACLVALGKIGRDGKGVDLEAAMTERVRRDDQEVRETAVLALGIAGRKQALPALTALLRDDAEGRKLADRDAVRLRTRTFAAYALGMLARRSDDLATKQAVHELLWPLLHDKAIVDRDLRTALVSAIGVLRPDTDSATDKRLAWLAVDNLLGWFEEDLGAGDELVQAHAPIAIARLLGRGTSTLHQQVKQHFVATLTSSHRRGNAILQSVAVALGMLVVGDSSSPVDVEARGALQQLYERGHDMQARQFAVIALGRIGGDADRKWLLSAYTRGNKSNERPWLAIALGLLAEPAARRGEPDGTIATMLLQDLDGASSNDLRSALALGIGLTGHGAAVPVMINLLRDNEGQEQFAGYLCMSLALLGDTAAVPTLSSILERSARRPFLLLQCAVALGCLGDHDANDRLLKMIDGNQSVAVLSALAAAIGRIGDRRAIDPLITMTTDKNLAKLARAFVAASLGGIGDKDLLPWNTPLSVDCNYATTVDTLTNGSTGVLDIL